VIAKTDSVELSEPEDWRSSLNMRD